MKPLVLAPGARAEFDAAAEWYESQAAGLGVGFVHCIDEALQRIAESPCGFPKWDVDNRFRRVVTRKFPYLVFYRELADCIEIIAIAHGAREPGYWLKRR
jgi:plasmid stabilization system protein ParE